MSAARLPGAPEASAIVERPALLHLPPDLLDDSPDDARRTKPGAEAEAAMLGSVQVCGVLQPILVSPLPGGRFEIRAGHRRVRAARAAGLDAVPAMVVLAGAISDEAASAAENMVRAPLDPVDQWLAAKALMDRGWSAANAAQALGLSERAARRFEQLARIHPTLLDAMRGPDANLSAHELRAISNAPPELQLGAFKRAGRDSQGRPNWGAVYASLRATRIPRSRAWFDVAASNVVFHEDMFAQPGSDEQFTTGDTEGFLAAQRQAVEQHVFREDKAGRRAMLVVFKSDYDVTLPKGWIVDWTETHALKDRRRGFKAGDSRMLFLSVTLDGHNLGAVRLYAGHPRAETGALASPGAPAPKPSTPTGPFTKHGLDLLAQAKNHALHARLTNPAQRPGPHGLLRMLVLALDAPNVQVQTNPQAGAPAYHPFADLAAGLSDASAAVAPADIEAAAAEALARIVKCAGPAPYAQNSGPKAEIIGLLSGASDNLPRFDTETYLACVTGDELRRLAVGAGIRCATVTGLKAALVGKLPDWRPTGFTAPKPDAAPAPYRDMGMGDDGDDLSGDDAHEAGA